MIQAVETECYLSIALLWGKFLHVPILQSSFTHQQ